MNIDLNKARTFHIFDQMPDAIMLLNADRRIEYLNPSASLLFEANPSDSIGSPPDRLFVPVTPYIRCEEILSIAQMDGFWRGNLVYVRKDGTKIHTECSINTFGDDQNTPAGFLVLIHDISKFFSAPENQTRPPEEPYFILGEFHKMEAINRLAGIIAHDFNNYLAGILGNLSVAVRKLDAKKPGAVTVMVIPLEDGRNKDYPMPERFFLNTVKSYIIQL